MTDDLSPVASSSPPTRPPAFLVYLGFGLAIVIGVVAQVGVLAAYRRGDMQLYEAAVVFAFCVGLAGAGLWYFYHQLVVVPQREQRLARTAALYPNEPWMLNDAWAQRRVVDRSGFGASIFLWIWSIGWWVGLALIGGVNTDHILAAVRSSWGSALLAAFLVFCGVLGLVGAIGMTRKWRRYGASTLRIDTLPGHLGNRFRGTVTARFPAETPIEAEIACERVTVRWIRTPKGGRRKEFSYDTRWSNRWPLERSRMTRTNDGSAVIPIDVALPSDQPPFATDAEGAGIRWMLYVRSDNGKPGEPDLKRADSIDLTHFAAEFPIPVYARD